MVSYLMLEIEYLSVEQALQRPDSQVVHMSRHCQVVLLIGDNRGPMNVDILNVHVHHTEYSIHTSEQEIFSHPHGNAFAGSGQSFANRFGEHLYTFDSSILKLLQYFYRRPISWALPVGFKRAATS